MIIRQQSIALPLGAAHRRLDRAADGALGSELLADHAVLVERAADCLGCTAKDSSFWTEC